MEYRYIIVLLVFSMLACLGESNNLLNQATNLENEGKYEEAIPILEMVIIIDPKNYPAILNLGEK